ncbi:glycosyltransferase [Microbacterium testaceum]|uniref:glycosyltransferase family protein n=1 Tax=Microbacterium testaceum TaxID=2033 RepID=UPI0025AF6E1F|nr:glycosyltransferase [Microbacterium testaceum]WJS91734.1 glycosyltransferase [Microbacterium testaceum]
MSLNPLFDDIVAGAELPEVLRVPALYAYLLSERETVRVHPWWDAEEHGRFYGGAGLEHAWSHPESEITLRVAGRSVTLSVAEVRGVALHAARSWRHHRVGGVALPAAGANGLVRPIQARDRRYARKLLQAATRAVGPRNESVVIPLVGVDASQWVSAHVLATVVPEIVLQGHPRRAAWTRVIDRASADLAVTTVVALDPRAEFTDDEIDALLEASDDRHVAMPAQRTYDGTVDGLGAAETGGPVPWGILSDHPAEDLDPLESVVSVPLLRGRSVAMASSLLRDTLKSDAHLSCTQFARALRTRAGVRVLTTVRPVLEEPLHIFDEKAPKVGGGAGDRGIAAAIVDQIGFDLIAWRPGDGAVVVPSLRWRRPRPDAQRWAIKICAPAGRQGAVWGDMHFARGLASALRRRGHTVVIDAFGAQNRSTAYLDDVNVVVRGPYRIDPPKTGINLQWIISHPDDISRDELSSFDQVFAASVSWSKQVGQRWGIDVTPLLEATDVDLFTPRGVARTDEIVFVGTARGIARPSVVAPLRAGIPVRVYGPDWRPFIPHSAIAARTVPHSELPCRYESASIVLNDQWPAMRRHGFIAMRPFDVVAVGGRVISEDVEGIGEIFDGAVVTYRDAEHLVELLRMDPETLFPDRDTLARIAERIRSEHSFDARATVLMETARTAGRGLRR